MQRSYDVVPTGVQSFEQRFPGKNKGYDEGIPELAEWRCNLTGLSQKYNLLFVAYGCVVYVYVPQFPSQVIGEPVLVIPSRPTGSGSYGRPVDDSINNLLVASLGTEEVVATVRHNGDMDAVLVRHVVQAIRARSHSRLLGILADEIRPQFQGNVGISAWGLAIHTEARIIAVSSNSHEVTIFKLGLVIDHGIEQKGQLSDTEKRQSDVIVQILNGGANIPSIAFCNTGDDPHARWLLTTDISGVCRAMDLHKSQRSQEFRFGRRMDSVYGDGFDRLNAGWCIMFLDQRSFYAESTFNAAVGLKEHESLPDEKDASISWDLSRTVRSLPDLSNAFMRHQTKASTPQRQEPPESRSSAMRAILSSIAQDPDVDVEIFQEIAIVDEEDYSIAVPELVDDVDEGDEGTEDTTPSTAFYGGERICANLPRFQTLTTFCDNLPCPVLHASVRNIYMIQPTKEQRHWQPPFVGIAAPLKQSIEVQNHALNMFDRLNMSAYIPALGIVVIASQKGRAIVLALTKLDKSASYPPKLTSCGSKTNHSMRVEAILPYNSQEKLNQRPFAPLHGITAGPMQGSESLPDEKKRWRLLLMYQDHSMLSYEIARRQTQAVVVV